MKNTIQELLTKSRESLTNCYNTQYKNNPEYADWDIDDIAENIGASVSDKCNLSLSKLNHIISYSWDESNDVTLEEINDTNCNFLEKPITEIEFNNIIDCICKL